MVLLLKLTYMVSVAVISLVTVTILYQQIPITTNNVGSEVATAKPHRMVVPSDGYWKGGMEQIVPNGDFLIQTMDQLNSSSLLGHVEWLRNQCIVFIGDSMENSIMAWLEKGFLQRRKAVYDRYNVKNASDYGFTLLTIINLNLTIVQLMASAPRINGTHTVQMGSSRRIPSR